MKESAGAITRETNVKTLPRIASVVGGGETKEGENQNERVRWRTVAPVSTGAYWNRHNFKDPHLDDTITNTEQH